MSIEFEEKEVKTVKKEKASVDKPLLVKGIFRNHEDKGSTISFPFYQKESDTMNPYSFTDGEEYEIPIELALHLRNNCCYDKYERALDDQGRPVTKVVGKIHRFGFEELGILHNFKG